MTQHQNEIPKPNIQALKTMHVAMIGMLVTFILIVFYNQGSFVTDLDYKENPLLIIVPCFAILGYFLSQTLFNKQLQKIDKRQALQNKWGAYQTACLIKYGIIEGPTLLAIVAYYHYPHAMYLTIAVFMILYFFKQRPTTEKIKNDLSL